MVKKAVPVVVRKSFHGIELLVFDHPLAGRQLVKGTIEAGEGIEEAAKRELMEESGLVDVQKTIYLGSQDYPEIDHKWHFVLCEFSKKLPERWEHFTEDGGGLIFRFLWQPLDQPIDNPVGPVFEEARKFIAQQIA